MGEGNDLTRFIMMPSKNANQFLFPLNGTNQRHLSLRAERLFTGRGTHDDGSLSVRRRPERKATKWPTLARLPRAPTQEDAAPNIISRQMALSMEQFPRDDHSSPSNIFFFVPIISFISILFTFNTFSFSEILIPLITEFLNSPKKNKNSLSNETKTLTND